MFGGDYDAGTEVVLQDAGVRAVNAWTRLRWGKLSRLAWDAQGWRAKLQLASPVRCYLTKT